MSNHHTDVRAEAARGLADVAIRGASLREVVSVRAPLLADPRDRALLSALLNEGARWWLRFDPAIDALLERPLKRRDPELHALLVLGLVQLEVLGLTDYAAVAASVEAARTLGRPRHAGLVNAVLRRWQRERETRLQELDRRPHTRSAHPRWIINAVREDWPQQLDAILEADNREPPLMLRVNSRRGSREQLLAQLADAGIAATAHAWLSDALVLERSTDVTALPGFAEGLFAVQDGAAQACADLLDLADGQRVLDACAAPGGKACHILERADVTLTALDSEPRRLERVRANLDRLGLSANVRAGDAGDPPTWWDGTPFDRILVDAPCSALGVVRRRPDVRLHRRPSDIAALQAQQARLLDALWPLLAPGGRLLYVTCSLLRAENEVAVAGLLARHPDAHARPVQLPAGQPAGDGWQLLPGDAGLDGLFFAALEKPAA
jgi:16S rRNA (cytosine967-C5)-methyltransferase